MKFRSYVHCFMMLMFFSMAAYAQEGNQPKEKFSDRLITGGGIGLQFGDYTYIQVTPILGYRVTERFHAGIGLNYTYYKYNDKAYNYQYETSIYGGSIWSRYFVFENLFAEATYEMLNMDVPNVINGYYSGTKRDNIPILMVGGGYAQSIGGQSALLLRILWDVIEDPYSPYSNPIFSIGFSIGL
jgi:hypothetical protein